MSQVRLTAQVIARLAVDEFLRRLASDKTEEAAALDDAYADDYGRYAHEYFYQRPCAPNKQELE